MTEIIITLTEEQVAAINEIHGSAQEVIQARSDGLAQEAMQLIAQRDQRTLNDKAALYDKHRTTIEALEAAPPETQAQIQQTLTEAVEEGPLKEG